MEVSITRRRIVPAIRDFNELSPMMENLKKMTVHLVTQHYILEKRPVTSMQHALCTKIEKNGV